MVYNLTVFFHPWNCFLQELPRCVEDMAFWWCLEMKLAKAYGETMLNGILFITRAASILHWCTKSVCLATVTLAVQASAFRDGLRLFLGLICGICANQRTVTVTGTSMLAWLQFGCSRESRMSGGSLRGLLFFGHWNKFTVTVTVTVIYQGMRDCKHCKHCNGHHQSEYLSHSHGISCSSTIGFYSKWGKALTCKRRKATTAVHGNTLQEFAQSIKNYVHWLTRSRSRSRSRSRYFYFNNIMFVCIYFS